MRRVKNLKYDPMHADKKQCAYSHLEYLDKIFSLERAKRIIEYEKKKYGRPVTMEIVELQSMKKKADKGEKNDINK